MNLHETTLSLAAMHVNDSLLQQLECPVCLDICQPPIFMCVNGHNVCSSCQAKITECPVCRTSGTPSIRNIFAEDTSSRVLTPCRYKPGGCKAKMNLSDLEAHVSSCDYQYKCLACGDLIGSRMSLYDHVRTKHPGRIVSEEGRDKLRTWKHGLDKDKRILMLCQWENELFWINLRYRVNEASFYFYCQYVGSKENAEKFKFEFKISSTDKKTTTMSFSGPALRLEEDYKESRNTIELSRKTLEAFTRQDGSFVYSRNIQRM